MTQQEMQSLADPINRLLERAGGQPLPMQKLKPANFIEMFTLLVDVIAPPDDGPEEVEQLAPPTIDAGVNLAARMGGRRTSRDPTRSQISAAKLAMSNALGVRVRK